MFSKVKAWICRTNPRSVEAVVDAMGTALSQVNEKNGRGWYQHVGFTIVPERASEKTMYFSKLDKPYNQKIFALSQTLFASERRTGKFIDWTKVRYSNPD